jgi:bifunctional DNase/RNase
MIKVVIDSVRMPVMAKHQNMRIIVLNEVEGSRYLPIWVQAYYADPISISLQRISTDRPLPFDLMKTLIDLGNLHIEYVAISRLQNDVYYATLAVMKKDSLDSEPAIVDCRPCDALAVALKTGAPIFVVPEIMEEQGIEGPPSYRR